MKPLKAVFEQQEQASKTARSASEESYEEYALIRFMIGGSVFAVDIEKVLEVSEMLPIVRYPESAFGHEGIVNLRGNIIPVLNFRDQQAGSHLKILENRLVVLEFTPGRRFCAMVSSPKKVSLTHEIDNLSQEIVSIDGMPTRIVSEKDFPAAIMLEEEGK